MIMRVSFNFPRWYNQDERGCSLSLMFGVGGGGCCLSYAAEVLPCSEKYLLVGLKFTYHDAPACLEFLTVLIMNSQCCTLLTPFTRISRI